MFGTDLFLKYNNYCETKLKHLTHKHHEIVELIDNLKNHEIFEIEELGKSIEDRSICCLKAGSGKINVALWSQMHGNEPTATMALFDVLNFFKSSDEFNSQRNEILQNITLHIVPLLNPDGAERFVRENALGIDLNRDAARLLSPESQILKSLIDKTKSDFGFNLHDQSRAFGAAKTSKPATISFLAPAANFEKSIDEKREKSMKVIVGMGKVVNHFSPGCTGRYSDDFEPRAFGDNIQKWGTCTILIESGGAINDFKRQYVRKLNFAIVLDALLAIANDSYMTQKTDDYFQIPQNEKNFFDLLIKNATLINQEKQYKVDIGVNYHEQQMHDVTMPLRKSTIVAIGDLSTMFGYQELNADGYTIKNGEIYPETISTPDVILANQINYLKKGYISFSTTEFPGKDKADELLIDLIPDNTLQKNNFAIDEKANFLLMKNNIVHFVVSNGKLIKL
jgi:hypothetical protein